MRKSMEVIGLMTLGYLYWITYAALNGPERLPDRVPTHFDISGQANAWGSPNTLWLLPVIGSGLYLLFTVLGSIRFRSYNLPVRVTEENLPFIQEQTSVMLAWIKFELLGLFVYIQSWIIEGVRTGNLRLSPAVIPVFMVVILGTVGVNLAILISGAKKRAELPDGAGRTG